MIQRWCGESKFSDGDLVREKKLLLFLQEVVLPMRTVPRTRKSMSQRLDSKRKRNAASKRRKRAKIAQENGKNVVGTNAPATSCPAEPESDEEDSDEDEEIPPEVNCPESLYSMLLIVLFYRVSRWLPTRSNQAIFQLLYPCGKIKLLKNETNTPTLGAL
jgi:hypothetical protein